MEAPPDSGGASAQGSIDRIDTKSGEEQEAWTDPSWPLLALNLGDSKKGIWNAYYNAITSTIAIFRSIFKPMSTWMMSILICAFPRRLCLANPTSDGPTRLRSQLVVFFSRRDLRRPTVFNSRSEIDRILYGYIQ